MALRSLTLFELLVWVYRDQRAHKYLRKPQDWWRLLIDSDDLLSPDKHRPQLRRDAVAVHAAVVELAELGHPLVHYALQAAPPEPWDHSITPRPVYAEADRSGDLYGRAMIDGVLTDYKIAVAEHVSEQIPIMRRVSKRRMVLDGWRNEPIDVKYCPIRYEPDPEWIRCVDGIFDTWLGAMQAFASAMARTRLTAHEIVDLSNYAGRADAAA
jgi:hypothetical protein